MLQEKNTKKFVYHPNYRAKRLQNLSKPEELDLKKSVPLTRKTINYEEVRKNKNQSNSISSRQYNTIELRFEDFLADDLKQAKKSAIKYTVSIKQRKKQSPMKKINPYTNSEYLYFQKNSLKKKQSEILEKEEKLTKILKPFQVSQVQFPQNKPKRVHSYIVRPRTTGESKYLQRLKSTRKELRNLTARDMYEKSLEGQIRPWGEQYSIIKQF